VEYLSLALANAKSITPAVASNADIELIQDLQDRMDVAHIQVQILCEFQKLSDFPNSLIENINKKLHDISTVTTYYHAYMMESMNSIHIFSCFIVI
jgi:hypothetical protein